jgi:hypothetical protein
VPAAAIDTNRGVKSKTLASKSKLRHAWYACWALLLVLGLLYVQTRRSSATQAPAIAPLPTPNLASAPRTDAGPVATIAYAHSSVRSRARGGQFRLAGIHAHETVNVRLQFSPEFAGARFFAAALDGGEASVPGRDSVVASDGTISMLYRAGDQPGLYRVQLSAGGNRSVLKFWVANPKDPQSNPPVVQPGN